MSKPISPDEVGAYKTKIFPAVVFDAFNELIAGDYVDGSATVKQKDVVALIKIKDPELEIFKNGYLNVEQVYRDAGWNVYYDKPAYNEDYDAFFRFNKKKKS